MNRTPPQLEEIVSRAQTLYSRPTVAMEVVRLSEEPRVDADAIKRCIEKDPALACKVLRVVNSSLYGLNRPVADLNQAIGLLGIKSLKLLVLGFSLPDELFAEVAARELRWYWTNTLTRAVAARMISEQLWRQPGDEAFIAGLLQDIGILVLMRELGTAYVKFLGGVIDEKFSLAVLEQDTLGFDHTQLSAALLAHWQLPQRLVEAIATPKRQARLSRMSPPDGDLPQILHLAELLVQLVGQQRVHLLPELLEAGKIYRGMTKQNLTVLVEGLQPQVDQLAEVLSLELAEKRDYVQMLLDAHRAMASLSEDVAGTSPSNCDDDREHRQLLAHTRELSQAVQEFLASDPHMVENTSLAAKQVLGHAAHLPTGPGLSAKRADVALPKYAPDLMRSLVAAAKRCRERRNELSLLVVERNALDGISGGTVESSARQIRWALFRACSHLDREDVDLVQLGVERVAAILSDCDRRGAIDVAHNTVSAAGKPNASRVDGRDEMPISISIGVATVSVVPRNFDPTRLVESAERCLSAAHTCGVSAVKSIEV